MKRLALTLASIFTATALVSGVMEVSLKLPVRAKLPIKGDEKLLIAPFVIQTPEGDVKRDRSAKVDIQSEFSRYMRKQMLKSTKLKVIDAGALKLPSSDWKQMSQNRDLWKDLAAKSGADLVVSGVIDFEIADKAGYRTEEYVSPVDGRTYYRQVLVESTGFVFDIVIGVFDGDSGEKLVEENFRDFKEFDQRDYDEILGLFENLRSLETQLLGIFVSQQTTATRYLFTE